MFVDVASVAIVDKQCLTKFLVVSSDGLSGGTIFGSILCRVWNWEVVQNIQAKNYEMMV